MNLHLPGPPANTLATAGLPGSTSPPPQSAPDLVTMVECVWRRRWVGLFFGVLFAVMGWLAAPRVLPAHFVARSLVRVTSPSGVVEQPRETPTAERSFRNTQVELVMLPLMLQDALATEEVEQLGVLGSDPDSAEKLKEWMEVELPGRSEIMRITVKHDQAEVAYVLCNAITDAYFAEVNRNSRLDSLKRIERLTELQKQNDAKLAEKRREARLMARQLGAGDSRRISLEAQADLDSHRFYSSRVREINEQIREQERLVDSIKYSPGELVLETPQESTQTVRYAMFRARLETERQRARLGPRHPAVLDAAREESLLREHYQSTLEQEELVAEKDPVEELLREPQVRLRTLRSERAYLQDEMQRMRDQMDRFLNEDAAALEEMVNDITLYERLRERLWTTRQSLEMEQQADPRIQLVSPAHLPNRRDTSRQKKLGIVMAGGGFGLALFLAAVAELLTGALHSSRDATQRTGLEILTMLPRLPASAAVSLAGDSPALKRLRARMDMFVARLLHHPRANQPRTILVTAARWLAERDHLAAHLAAALARTGQRTILVNLDLRDTKPRIEFSRNPIEEEREQFPEAAEHADADEDPADVEADFGNGRTESEVHDAYQEPVPASADAPGRNLSSSATLADELGHEVSLQGSRTAPTPFPAEMPLIGTGVANLDLLQPEDRGTDPLPILTHPQLQEVLEALQLRYAYVVIEVAGVLEYPDAVHLGRLADAAVLSLLRNTSRASSVCEASERLGQLGCPVFGALIQ